VAKIVKKVNGGLIKDMLDRKGLLRRFAPPTFFLPLPNYYTYTMESTRQKKVSRLIQKELADIFLRKNNELAPGKLLSVTIVRVSPDLSFAKVFLSVFPSADQNVVVDSIKDHTAKIRFELGQKVRTQLRIVPEIAFYIDDSLDYIDNIDKLLKS
jgi:ribosome-binding factor A